jgi:NADH dehydrogenase FAD-containing subunit
MRQVQQSIPHLVILGGGYAGMLAAIRLAGRGALRITLVNAVPHFVERIRLHQLASQQRLAHRPLEALLRGTGVQRVIGRALHIDAATQRVQIEQPDGAQLSLAWDYLLYALGSEASQPPIPGLTEHLHSVASEASARRLATRISQLAPGQRVAVIGGGLTGIETASELAERHPALRVSLISDGTIAPSLSARGRLYVRQSLQALGIELREGTRLIAAEPAALTLATGSLPVAAAVLCAGFTASRLAAQSGLPINGSGQLLIDRTMRVPGHENIFGCGDGAGFSQNRLRMACATAMPMAGHAADNLTALLRGEALRELEYSFFAQCVSIGRQRGILQRVNAEDAPLPFIVTGGMGARLKEAICRYTTLTLTIERRFGGTFSWPGRRRARALALQPNLLS